MNYFTLRADLDGTIDETTWGFGGFSGECGGQLMNKPVPKGGQVVMLLDINCHYPQAYEHRHALHPPHAKFSCKGPAEMFRLVNKIDHLIDGNESVTIEYNHPSKDFLMMNGKLIKRTE